MRADDGERLRALLERAPLLSPTALRLVSLLADPEHAMNSVIEVVGTDARLALAVMHASNSVVFSAGIEIRGLQQAIVRLGAAQVLAIAMDTCTTPAGHAALQSQPGLAEGYWAHSLSTAIAARQLARKLPGRASPDQAYTAGLVHDIGRPALALLALHKGLAPPAEFRHGLSAVLEDEQTRFGLDHARAGWEALRSWGLPVEQGLAILHHHDPENAPLDLRPLATLLQLADRLAHRAMVSLGKEERAGSPRDASDRGIERAGMEGLVQSVAREFVETGSTLLGGRERA